MTHGFMKCTVISQTRHSLANTPASRPYGPGAAWADQRGLIRFACSPEQLPQLVRSLVAPTATKQPRQLCVIFCLAPVQCCSPGRVSGLVEGRLAAAKQLADGRSEPLARRHVCNKACALARLQQFSCADLSPLFVKNSRRTCITSQNTT